MEGGAEAVGGRNVNGRPNANLSESQSSFRVRNVGGTNDKMPVNRIQMMKDAALAKQRAQGPGSLNSKNVPHELSK